MSNIENDIVKEIRKFEQQKEINFATAKIKNEMNEIRNKIYSVQIVMLLIPTVVLILVESPIRFLLMHWIIQFTIGTLAIMYMYRIQNKYISKYRGF